MTWNRTWSQARPLLHSIRNHNPVNIRHSDKHWLGMVESQTDPRYVQFTAPKYAFRALALMVRRLHREKVTTVRGIVEHLADPEQHDIEDYIYFTARRVRINSDTPLALNQQTLHRLIKSFMLREVGVRYADVYPDRMIDDGITLSHGEEVDEAKPDDEASE